MNPPNETVVPFNRAFEAAMAELVQVQERLKEGDAGGTSGGMEARVAKLEAHVEHIRSELGKLSSVPTDLAVLQTRVDHLPSKGFILTSAISTVAAVVGLLTLLSRLGILAAH